LGLAVALQDAVAELYPAGRARIKSAGDVRPDEA
jgi:hypothetical protein